MLSPEEGWARLDAQRIPRWQDRADDRAGKLKRGFRDSARAFLAPRPGYGAPGDVRRHQRRQLEAAGTLDGLSAGNLTAVMTALHPGLGAALARWWVDAQSQPYQRSWDRKAFRAPGAAGLTIEARARDLGNLIQTLGMWEADPAWLACWAGHLTLGGRPLARVSDDLAAC